MTNKKLWKDPPCLTIISIENYGTSPCLTIENYGKSTISMAIFNPLVI